MRHYRVDELEAAAAEAVDEAHHRFALRLAERVVHALFVLEVEVPQHLGDGFKLVRVLVQFSEVALDVEVLGEVVGQLDLAFSGLHLQGFCDQIVAEGNDAEGKVVLHEVCVGVVVEFFQGVDEGNCVLFCDEEGITFWYFSGRIRMRFNYSEFIGKW